MIYHEAKVYNDGSHYIAIPHTTRPSKPRYTPFEERVEVKDENKDKDKDTEIDKSTPSEREDVPFVLEESEYEILLDVQDIFEENIPPPANSPRFATLKEIFEEGYKESLFMHKRERKRFLIDKMRPYFDDEEKTKLFVEAHLERKLRNLITRRIRLTRKINLQEFNYFCTFTYDSQKHTEESFRYKFRHTISNFAKRKGWKYVGVWERSPEKQRLHFHGIFFIPEGTMPGMFIEVEDYNFKSHRRQVTNQSIYFNERFGRSDFEPITDPRRLGEAKAYLMKYIEKSGEKLVYSRGLPQFFISDIMDEDIVCNIGSEEAKLLLYDDFSCYDQGVFVGQVSSDVIKQLRKAN
jgi:hypothetical protein